ncbi:biotin transport system substrate-specific component [Arthrobacter pigmenti]|uniref:Biotin transporter n=1 Tax=Arthrobacter pigmenti TaxID=271432 RepID=A0A846RQ92_9MICC|nr:biotin transporter BioY [Arthrobacter pigmenti]NJC22327.1 biotin transport system substrate-specific component [Arthrobacter pigmenti]
MQQTNQIPRSSPTETVKSARRSWNATDLSLIAVFAAVVATSAILPAIPVGQVGVPITLQTLAIMVTGIVLGPWRAGAALGLYVAVGLAGLPIFSQFRGGIGILFGPSAGYIIAFPLAAMAIGFLARLIFRRIGRLKFLALFVACTVTSLLITHPLGIVGMMVNAKLDLPAAVAADVVFLPGDILKNLAAAAIGLSVVKAFPRLQGRAAGTR